MVMVMTGSLHMEELCFCLMHTGLAKSHNGDPCATMRVETCFGISVLLPGLSVVVLSQKEENILSHHFKVHVERLLRLHKASPRCLVFLLAGCLPLPGLLHLQMFSILLNMHALLWRQYPC